MSADTLNGSAGTGSVNPDLGERIPLIPIIERLEALGVSRGARRWAAFLMAKWLWRPGAECRESRHILAAEFSCGAGGYRRVCRWEAELRKSGVFRATSAPGKVRTITLAQGPAGPGPYGPYPLRTLRAQGSTDPEIRALRTLQTQETQPDTTLEGAPPAAPPSHDEPENDSEDLFGASVAPAAAQEPTAPRKRKPPKGPHPEVIAHWCKTFEDARGSPFVVCPKDAKAAKAMLTKAKGDVAEVKRRIDRAWADEWWQSKLNTLVQVDSRWNSWLPPAGEAADEEDPYSPAAITKARGTAIKDLLAAMKAGTPYGLRLLHERRQSGQSDEEIISAFENHIAATETSA